MKVEGKVIAGHGVASGRCPGDPRFPGGTLGPQLPIFGRLGLDLDGLYQGTINVSVSPLIPEPVSPSLTFRDVRWHPDFVEDFSFFEIRFAVKGDAPVDAFIYWPHPETKPEHFQDPHVVEVLAPKIEGIREGKPVELWVDPGMMRFE